MFARYKVSLEHKTCLDDDGTSPIVILCIRAMTLLRSGVRSCVGYFHKLYIRLLTSMGFQWYASKVRTTSSQKWGEFFPLECWKHIWNT